MKVRRGDTIQLTIDKMAFGGLGMARLNGLVVFVRGGVPGDRVLAKVYRKKKDYAEAVIAELLVPSPERISPPCPYSGYCGGCQMQHIRYEKQLEFKKGHIAESLERIGGLKNVPVRDVIPSQNIFAYRNKMEFSFSDRRWFLPHEMEKRETVGGFALGLHVPGTYSKVLDVEACLLQREEGNQILREVKQQVKESGIPVYGLKSHEGFWRFLMIRYSFAFDEWMVNLVTSEERPELLKPLAETLCRQMDRIKTVVNNINRRKASVAIGDHETVLLGEGRISDRIGPFTFQISANSFFQTNSHGAEKLYQSVVECAQFRGDERVLDLYSGTGTIPIFIADRVGGVTGIEINNGAVTDARRNCKENRIDNCLFLCGDMREKLSEITHRPDVVIIDPPRAGMHKDVPPQILSLSAEKIIYISCNPATMARDMGLMIQNYEPVEIQPVDMFPHTYHIEAVAKLQRRKK